MADRDEKRRTNENRKQTKRPKEVRELEKVRYINATYCKSRTHNEHAMVSFLIAGHGVT